MQFDASAIPFSAPINMTAAQNHLEWADNSTPSTPTNLFLKKKKKIHMFVFATFPTIKAFYIQPLNIHICQYKFTGKRSFFKFSFPDVSFFVL